MKERHQTQPPNDAGSSNYDAGNPTRHYDAAFDQIEVAPLLYCPWQLDLKSKLIEAGARDLARHLWKFYYVLTLLYLHRWHKTSSREEFRRLNASKLRQVLGDHTRSVLETLRSMKIIEIDDRFIVGRESKGYRLCEPYQSGKFRQVSITELPRFPKVARKFCRHRITPRECDEHHHLLASLCRVTLTDGCFELVSKTSSDKPYCEDYYIRSIEWIRTGQWFFCCDPRTGRVFNNVVNLPRTLRGFLRIDGQPLVELDVANCQPFLLLDLYPHKHEPERDKFARIVLNGQFYEFIDSKQDVPYGERGRSELKEAILTVIFDRNRPTPSKIFRVLQNEFPLLAHQIQAAKRPRHNALALRLQKLEAEVIIHTVIRQIARNGKFPVLTIHDSILTLPQYTGEVSQLLREAFAEKFGVCPQIREKQPCIIS